MRRPRELAAGAAYEVSARIEYGKLAKEPGVTRYFLISAVARAKDRYRFEVGDIRVDGDTCGFVIMPLEGESLSRIMQWIMGVFASSCCRFYRTSGHIWASRFSSRIVEGAAWDRQLTADRVLPPGCRVPRYVCAP